MPSPSLSAAAAGQAAPTVEGKHLYVSTIEVQQAEAGAAAVEGNMENVKIDGRKATTTTTSALQEGRIKAEECIDSHYFACMDCI